MTDRSFDPFAGSGDDSYNINRAYTRATNKHDHAANVQVPMMREHVAMIQAIVQDPAYPDYTSNQAFIRDAIVHRLHHIAKNENDVIQMQNLSTLAKREAISEREERRKAEQKWVEQMAQSIAELRGGGGGELETLIWELQEMVDEKTMFESNELLLRRVIDSARNFIAHG